MAIVAIFWLVCYIFSPGNAPQVALFQITCKKLNLKATLMNKIPEKMRFFQTVVAFLKAVLSFNYDDALHKFFGSD